MTLPAGRDSLAKVAERYGGCVASEKQERNVVGWKAERSGSGRKHAVPSERSSREKRGPRPCRASEPHQPMDIVLVTCS